MNGWAPMALTLCYGLVFTIPLTLVLIPGLYVISDDIANLSRRKVQKQKEIVAGT